MLGQIVIMVASINQNFIKNRFVKILCSENKCQSLIYTELVYKLYTRKIVYNNYLLFGIVPFGQKYPCLFSESATISKVVATSVLQYHIIPGKTLSYQQLKNLAQNGDYMSTTAFNGKKLNITMGANRINGYSTINNPDIGTKQSQVIHGIKTLLVPPGFTVS